MSAIEWKTQGELAIGFTPEGETVVIAPRGISSSRTAVLASPARQSVGKIEVSRYVLRDVFGQGYGADDRGHAERWLVDTLRRELEADEQREPITWRGDR